MIINKLKRFVDGAAEIAESEDWDEGNAQEFILGLAELKPELDKYLDNIQKTEGDCKKSSCSTTKNNKGKRNFMDFDKALNSPNARIVGW